MDLPALRDASHEPLRGGRERTENTEVVNPCFVWFWALSGAVVFTLLYKYPLTLPQSRISSSIPTLSFYNPYLPNPYVPPNVDEVWGRPGAPWRGLDMIPLSMTLTNNGNQSSCGVWSTESGSGEYSPSSFYPEPAPWTFPRANPLPAPGPGATNRFDFYILQPRQGILIDCDSPAESEIRFTLKVFTTVLGWLAGDWKENRVVNSVIFETEQLLQPGVSRGLAINSKVTVRHLSDSRLERYVLAMSDVVESEVYHTNSSRAQLKVVTKNNVPVYQSVPVLQLPAATLGAIAWLFVARVCLHPLVVFLEAFLAGLGSTQGRPVSSLGIAWDDEGEGSKGERWPELRAAGWGSGTLCGLSVMTGRALFGAAVVGTLVMMVTNTIWNDYPPLEPTLQAVVCVAMVASLSFLSLPEPGLLQDMSIAFSAVVMLPLLLTATNADSTVDFAGVPDPADPWRVSLSWVLLVVFASLAVFGLGAADTAAVKWHSTDRRWARESCVFMLWVVSWEDVLACPFHLGRTSRRVSTLCAHAQQVPLVGPVLTSRASLCNPSEGREQGSCSRRVRRACSCSICDPVTDFGDRDQSPTSPVEWAHRPTSN